MWITFSIVFFFYLTYFLVLLSYNKNSYIEREKDTNFYPSVSMIVPVYNEQTIIAKKMTNIKEMKYPNDKLEVIFVDGNSTDNTKKIIIEKIKDSNKNIKLIEQKKRKGYTQAVIQGILTSKGEIIFATDAASYHYPDTINQLVKHFTDPKIGAVTGKEIVLGQEKKIGPKLEKSYRLFYDFMRKAETKIDSTPDSKGEILAVRKKICINLIDKLELSPNASFDSCVPYQAKMMGLRTVYEDKARYYEYAPSSFLDRMKEKSRRATLLIGALLLFKEMILNRKYGKFGVIVLPVHFIINCILPMIFVVGVFSLVLLSFLNPIASIIPWVLAAGLLIATNNSRSLLISFIQSQIALIMGLFKLIRREKTLFIESIPSTRSLPNEQ
jgi:cellulose synthase/poly-beta-1,6-N-acetylglucosamine synthase-like glycosyltransferase